MRKILFIVCCFIFNFYHLNGGWESLTDENRAFLAKIRQSLNLEHDYGAKIINGVFDFVKDSGNIEDLEQGVDLLLDFGNVAQIAGKKDNFRLAQTKLHILMKKITILKKWTIAEHVKFLLKRLPEDCKYDKGYCLGYWSYINESGRVYLLIKELSKIRSKVPENRIFINKICDKFLKQYQEYSNE